MPLTEMLKKATEDADVELLIVLDQFEEYLDYPSAAEGEGGFAAELARAVTSPGLRANFLISIREDWLARLDRFKGRMPNPFDNSIRVDTLDREAAKCAVLKPVGRYNEFVRRYNEEAAAPMPEAVVEDEFAEKLLDQIERLDERDEAEAGATLSPEMAVAKRAARSIQTPQLQIVLHRLWEKVKGDSPPTLGPELLADDGTARTIIRTHINEALEHLTGAEKLAAANLFRFLVTPYGTKVASTAKWLAAQVGQHDAKRLRPLLEKLSERKAIILDRVAPAPGQEAEPRYQFTSDALARFVLEWSGEVRTRRRRWDATRKRLFIASFAAVSLIAFVVASSYWKVSQQQSIAEAARLDAERQRTLAVQQKEEAQRALSVIKRLDGSIPYSKAVLRGHSDAVTSAAFYAGGRVLTASADGTARLWDVETKESTASWGGEPIPLTRAASNRDGDLIATADARGSVTLRRVVGGGVWFLREPNGSAVNDIAFSPAGDLLAAAGADGTLAIWNIAYGMPSGQPTVFTGHTGEIRRLVFSRNGTFIATAGADNTARIWRVADLHALILQEPDAPRPSRPQAQRVVDRQVPVLQGHVGPVNGVAFSPDEKLIVTASADKTVRVWSTANGSGHLLGRHAAGVNSAEFNEQGDRVVTAGDDAVARIWKLNSPEPLVLSGHTDAVLSAAFSPDGKQVVTASRDTTARVWSSVKGQSQAKLRGHPGSVTSVKGQSQAELRGHLGPVTSAVFSDDGRLVLTASADATARVWAVPQPGSFEIEQPTIDAIPAHYVGPCPVAIRFFVKITASASGTVLYRFRGSDGRIWPARKLDFDGPGSKYVNWYWKLNDDYVGSESVEIVDPQGVEPQKAKFTVRCTDVEEDAPEPGPVVGPSP